MRLHASCLTYIKALLGRNLVMGIETVMWIKLNLIPSIRDNLRVRNHTCRYFSAADNLILLLTCFVFICLRHNSVLQQPTCSVFIYRFRYLYGSLKRSVQRKINLRSIVLKWNRNAEVRLTWVGRGLNFFSFQSSRSEPRWGFKRAWRDGFSWQGRLGLLT